MYPEATTDIIGEIVLDNIVFWPASIVRWPSDTRTWPNRQEKGSGRLRNQILKIITNTSYFWIKNLMYRCTPLASSLLCRTAAQSRMRKVSGQTVERHTVLTVEGY